MTQLSAERNFLIPRLILADKHMRLSKTGLESILMYKLLSKFKYSLSFLFILHIAYLVENQNKVQSTLSNWETRISRKWKKIEDWHY